MRLVPASLSLGALLSAGCALVGYNFEGYGPAGTSVGGGAPSGVGGGVTTSATGVGGGEVGGGEVGGGEASISAATGTGGAGPCMGFAPGVDIGITHASKFLIVADLAGSTGATQIDNLPEIVATSDIALKTSVLYNKGNGKLDVTAGPSSMAIGTPSNIAFGDMNADGLPDLVHLSAVTGRVSYAFNVGNEFGDWSSLNLAPSPVPSLAPGAVISAQIDASGPEDLVVALGPKLTVFLFGPGGALLPMQLERQLPFEATDLDVAKLDGDTVNDGVITSMAKSQVAIIYGGNDAAATPVIYPVAANPVRSGLADFNGDGALDIVTTSAGSNQLSLLINDGKGHFTPTFVNVGIPTGGLAAADYNGDQKQDLAVSGNGAILVLLGQGDGTFKVPIELYGLPHSSVIRAADMNGDGAPDLVEGSDTTFKVRMFLNCR